MNMMISYQELVRTFPKQTEFYNFDADELAKLIALYEKPDETIGCIIPSETEIQEK